MTTTQHAARATAGEGSLPAGIPAELWSWLRESLAVRPGAVAAARARLEAGQRPTSVQLADAVLRSVA